MCVIQQISAHFGASPFPVIFVPLSSLKIKALILLFCALAYVGEWLAMPARMAISARLETQARMAMPGLTQTPAAVSQAPHKMCCEKSMNAAGPSGCPKSNRANPGSANCCLDCPMCYTTILSLAREEFRPRIAKKFYPVYQSTYIYGYNADTWKPPNHT
jgi:hypothetical protein